MLHTTACCRQGPDRRAKTGTPCCDTYDATYTGGVLQNGRTVVVEGAERCGELRGVGRSDLRVGQRVQAEVAARKAVGVGQDGRVDATNDGHQPYGLGCLDQPAGLARVRNWTADDLAKDISAPNPVLLHGGRVQLLVQVGLLESEQLQHVRLEVNEKQNMSAGAAKRGACDGGRSCDRRHVAL